MFVTSKVISNLSNTATVYESINNDEKLSNTNVTLSVYARSHITHYTMQTNANIQLKNDAKLMQNYTV